MTFKIISKLSLENISEFFILFTNISLIVLMPWHANTILFMMRDAKKENIVSYRVELYLLWMHSTEKEL